MISTSNTPMSWNARSLRLTIFPAAEGNWPSWSDVTGAPAETSLTRAGLIQEEGAFADGQLSLLRQIPLRLDLIYSAVLSPTPESAGGPQSVGQLDAALVVFNPLANYFLVSAPRMLRVAFGLQLVKPSRSRVEAYDILSASICSSKFDFENAQEFSYQINRPRKSTGVDSNLILNRLSKWSAMIERLVIEDLSSGRVATANESYGASLEIDVSTAVDRGEPLQNPAELYGELAQLAVEISEKGDVK